MPLFSLSFWDYAFSGAYRKRGGGEGERGEQGAGGAGGAEGSGGEIFLLS